MPLSQRLEGLEGVERLDPSAVRVLMAVIAQHEEEGRATIRGVGERAGLNSSSTVHAHLRSLHRRGLVAWEPRRRGPLRPTVRRVK